MEMPILFFSLENVVSWKCWYFFFSMKMLKEYFSACYLSLFLSRLLCNLKVLVYNISTWNSDFDKHDWFTPLRSRWNFLKLYLSYSLLSNFCNRTGLFVCSNPICFVGLYWGLFSDRFVGLYWDLFSDCCIHLESYLYVLV